MRINFILFSGLLANAEAFQAHRAIHASQRTSSSTPLSAFVDIDEHAQRDVGAMDEWATMCEVQRADGFQLTTEDGSDFSAMTTADIAEGSPIVCVPGNMIISTASARAELGPNAEAVDFLTRNGSGDQVGKFFVFLKIMQEYEQGDQSPYWPWMNSLPRLYYNAISMTGKALSAKVPINFCHSPCPLTKFISFFSPPSTKIINSDFCYECLPPLVYRYAREEKVKFDNYFDALRKADCIGDQMKANKAVAKWCYNVVTTRTQGSNEEKFIAPMADMVSFCPSLMANMRLMQQCGQILGLILFPMIPTNEISLSIRPLVHSSTTERKRKSTLASMTKATCMLMPTKIFLPDPH